MHETLQNQPNPNALKRALLLAAGSTLAGAAFLGCASDPTPSDRIADFDGSITTSTEFGGEGSVTDTVCINNPELCDTGVGSGDGTYTPTPEIPDGGSYFPETGTDTTWGPTTTWGSTDTTFDPGDTYTPTPDTTLGPRMTLCADNPACDGDGDGFTGENPGEEGDGLTTPNNNGDPYDNTGGNNDPYDGYDDPYGG